MLGAGLTLKTELEWARHTHKKARSASVFVAESPTLSEKTRSPLFPLTLAASITRHAKAIDSSLASDAHKNKQTTMPLHTPPAARASDAPLPLYLATPLQRRLAARSALDAALADLAAARVEAAAITAASAERERDVLARDTVARAARRRPGGGRVGFPGCRPG